MAKAVKSQQAVKETPRKNKPLILEARWTLTKSVQEALTDAQIRRAVTQGTKSKIRTIVKSEIARIYRGSGLKVISGKLLADARRFTVTVTYARGKITVKLTWKPKEEYFFAQLFGSKTKITPKMRVFVHANDIIHPRASTKFIKIPAHTFIKFDVKIRRKITKDVFEPALQKALGASKQAEQKARLRKVQKQAGTARPSRRQMKKAGLQEFGEAMRAGGAVLSSRQLRLIS